MSAWPATLPVPLVGTYRQETKDNVIRSAMGYGPDKTRRRSAALIKPVTFQLVLTPTQMNTLQTFYETTVAAVGDIEWIDHTSANSPQDTVTYVFVAPPTYEAIDKENWRAEVMLEMKP